MKILQVIHNFLPYSYAGTEIYCYNLSKALSGEHNVFIFHRVRDENGKDYDMKRYKFEGLDIFAINNTCRSYNSFEDTYDNRIIEDRFDEILDIVKPDVVHIQHLLFLSIGIIRCIKKRSIPIVFTLHDYWLICPQGQLLRHDLSVCTDYVHYDCIKCIRSQLAIKYGILNIYYRLRDKFPPLLLQLLKGIYLNYAKNIFLSEANSADKIKRRRDFINRLLGNVDLFISPSKFLLDIFLNYGISQDKIISIQNGIDITQFKHLDRKKSNRIRFGFIGTIHPSKGLHILIEAFNKITAKNVELRIYGRILPYSGFEYYPRLLRKLCRHSNILFMGGFEASLISKIFSEIDILIVPSIWNENLPLVILEAFSSRTPVIASRIGGISELINDGINGFLFKANNSDDLYTKLKIIIDNDNIIEKLKNAVVLPKDMKENAREMAEIYTNLLVRR